MSSREEGRMRDASLTTTTAATARRLMILLILRGPKLVIVSHKLEAISKEPSISLVISSRMRSREGGCLMLILSVSMKLNLISREDSMEPLMNLQSSRML